MPSTTVLLSLAIAISLISLVLLVIYVQGLVDRDRIIATPNIRKEDGVLTAFASIKVNGTADEVFTVVKNYNEYSEWCPFSHYHWDEVDAYGVPHIGSTGTYKLSLDDFAERIIPVKLSMLDSKNRKLAEISTTYPKWLLSSERVQEVIPIEGHPSLCEYRIYQTIEGIGAFYILAAALEDMQGSQQRCATELKAYFEQRRP